MTDEKLGTFTYEADPNDSNRLLISLTINGEKRSVSFNAIAEEQFLNFRARQQATNIPNRRRQPLTKYQR